MIVNVGVFVSVELGSIVKLSTGEGNKVSSVGDCVGIFVGLIVGVKEGKKLGLSDSFTVGAIVGYSDIDGVNDGDTTGGAEVGILDTEGLLDITIVGSIDGFIDGRHSDIPTGLVWIPFM